jgi:hypothetical protein
MLLYQEYVLLYLSTCDFMGHLNVFILGPTTKGFSYLAGMSPYISLKIKKRHYEHHMIEAHKYLITWISDDIFFENSG